MKIVACSLVLNEELLIGRNIEHHAKYVDEWYIVEAAVRTMPGTTPEGKSSDKTASKVKDAAEAEGGKVKFRSYGWVDSVTEIMNHMIEELKEECWVLRIDPDEFYLPADLKLIQDFIEKYGEEAVALQYPFRHFYKLKYPESQKESKHLYQLKGGNWDNLQLRCFKFKPGWGFKHHHSISDEWERVLQTDPVYWGQRYFTDNIHIFHYNLCREAQKIQENACHYLKRDGYNMSKIFGKGTKYDELPDEVLDLATREFGFFPWGIGTYLEEYEDMHPIDISIF